MFSFCFFSSQTPLFSLFSSSFIFSSHFLNLFFSHFTLPLSISLLNFNEGFLFSFHSMTSLIFIFSFQSCPLLNFLSFIILFFSHFTHLTLCHLSSLWVFTFSSFLTLHLFFSLALHLRFFLDSSSLTLLLFGSSPPFFHDTSSLSSLWLFTFSSFLTHHLFFSLALHLLLTLCLPFSFAFFS